MINIKLTLAYDGSNFLGWQKTQEGPSIEETLQNILEKILQEPVTLQAASRTDAGVHAEGQIVNFFTNKQNVNLKKLCVSLNCLLPKALTVLDAKNKPLDFHPTLQCKGKEYHYWICHGSAQLPKHRNFSWHYPYTLDLDAMQEAASFFIGEHNYQAFCNDIKNVVYDNYHRKITGLQLLEWPGQRLQILIQGNNFLFRMVRNIVGTLVYVGRNKIPASDIPNIINSLDRSKAGPTAPPHGLTLYKVIY